ncbi:Aste57867_18326 [Aphanomyces stellatus]|uniref:Aste57867_18326 protein n=1 Tax=Aphanomyces stellatus TaxID=120398 RepID=A0A485KDD4_9STRA|nr:hypothetical protein As57867_018264 [Aphanomyces stellatus]KAF0711096.1 hypothetical protein As57867_005382 [Aphanomyces stellatus]VFT82453.1 Aste57867_5395 [Aphanomyces stellatus]VFT95062.1 Aste57867_18326 [Aphanomyces stellatus]
MASLRAIIAFVAFKNWAALQGDADVAFVQALMEKGILLFTDQPPGYEDGTDDKQLLLRALYGFKQSALAWYRRNRKIMIALGFRPSALDPCVYVRGSGDDIYIMEIVATYVDDFVVVAKTAAKADAVMDQLEAKIKMKRQGDVHFFLGIKVVRDRDAGTITLSQEAYACKVWERFGMANCAGCNTPEVDERDDLWHDDSQPKADQELYRSIVGNLLYLMTYTRPDLAHAVQRLSRHLYDLREPHMVGAKRVLRYVKQTASAGITFKGGMRFLAGTATQAGRRGPTKSTSGMICFVGSGAVAWRSSRQRTVALSTLRGRVHRPRRARQGAPWLRGFLQEQGLAQKTTAAHCDNKSAIATGETDAVTERSKHIDVRLHFIRDCGRRDQGALRTDGRPTGGRHDQGVYSTHD